MFGDGFAFGNNPLSLWHLCSQPMGSRLGTAADGAIECRMCCSFGILEPGFSLLRWQEGFLTGSAVSWSHPCLFHGSLDKVYYSKIFYWRKRMIIMKRNLINWSWKCIYIEGTNKANEAKKTGIKKSHGLNVCTLGISLPDKPIHCSGTKYKTIFPFSSLLGFLLIVYGDMVVAFYRLKEQNPQWTVRSFPIISWVYYLTTKPAPNWRCWHWHDDSKAKAGLRAEFTRNISRMLLPRFRPMLTNTRTQKVIYSIFDKIDNYAPNVSGSIHCVLQWVMV